MSRLYRTTDKINVKVGELEVTISPLDMKQKMDLQKSMIKASAGNADAMLMAVSDALKFAIKDIKGITYEDDNGNDVPYIPQFNNGQLSDETISDLMNLEESQKLNTICSSLIGGFHGKFVDSEGKELEGVSVISKKKVEDPKN